ncbi:activating signal cointegrator 1 complex subunit 1 [Pelomyxa schiedti]|nr:activating signal cointegrator 1 complex subunit 1 [Pelomyxa schiedti]
MPTKRFHQQITPSRVASSPTTIILRGQTEASIVAANTRIELLMASVFPKLPYTHFISIPLTDPAFSAGVVSFKKELETRFMNVRGMDPSILCPPSTFHLTVVMLRLYTDKALEKAVETLKSLSSRIYDVVRLEELEYMNDDPSEVDVLYVKVHPVDDRLTQACELIIQKFVDVELVPEQEKSLKLHATVINTRYRDTVEDASSEPKEPAFQPGRPPPQSQQPQQQHEEPERISFDARTILAQLGTFHFGEAPLRSIQLSKRGKLDPKTHYWPSLTSISLP